MLHLNGFTSLVPNFDEGNNRIGMLTSELSIRELLDIYRIEDTVNRDIN